MKGGAEEGLYGEAMRFPSLFYWRASRYEEGDALIRVSINRLLPDYSISISILSVPHLSVFFPVDYSYGPSYFVLSASLFFLIE